MRVGVSGTGIMGAPMVRNLLRAGHVVTVQSRSPARMVPLLDAGAIPASSPREVAAGVDAIVTSLPDAGRRIGLTSPNGILAGARPRAPRVDTSTSRLGGGLAARGGRRRRFPMRRSPAASRGACGHPLSVMAGGGRDACERAPEIFAAIGRAATYMGGSEQGQMTKLVNQVVGAATLTAVAEGIVLAARAGLDPGAVIEAVGGGAASSWMWTNLGPRMQRRDFAPGFMIRLQQKDLRLALAAAADVGAPLPLTALVQQLLAAVEAYDGGALGTQAVVTALEELARPRG
jgi:3-hydroxyisobutyrate dehydrogenase-like beta-hydroxyacid dehydrogenase